MHYCFGDIVVVENNLIGVVVKSFIVNNEEIEHNVYVRSYNCIKSYKENEMQRYMVRHKELNDEEINYQKEAIDPFIPQETIDSVQKFLKDNNII